MVIALPRVTEILNYYTNYDKVPRDILQNAAARGTMVHSYCAGIAKGEWIPDSMIQEPLQGYVESFRKWMGINVAKIPIIEKRFYNEEAGYTGQVDFVILREYDLWLVDIKTSAGPQKTYPVQMAAYVELLRIHGIIVKGAELVYLDKEGSFPKTNTLEDLTREKEVFFSALDCFKYFKGTKRYVRRKRSNNDTEESEESSSTDLGGDE